MAKHPHKLMLIDNRTWRCMLDGCAFFVHLGLAHVIVGKRIVCWKCEETFLVEYELSTREPKPTCSICRSGEVVLTPMQLDAYMKELTERNKKKKEEEPQQDEIENIPEDEGGHSSECAMYDGEPCNCK